MNDTPIMVKIEKIKDESPTHKTFFLKCKMENALPGQFFMVWIPGVDEKPLSYSSYDSKTETLYLTVEKKGIFTSKMFELKIGDKVGVRGPYGHGFTIKKDSCIIGGGCGIAPIRPLILSSPNPTVILGARSKELLMFKEEFPKANFATDDGTFGFKGFTTQVLEEMLSKKKFSIVQCCGPEIMMKRIFDICEKHGVECECSLERYMRCGIGVCADCVCSDQLVCKDGPVFNSEKLRKMSDFGNYARTKSGKKVALKEFYVCKTG
jgi:dihydroorotate dehydrogenase electron transfer subunit